jgi:hypothetical protein
MSTHKKAAIIATGVLVLLICFQILLAAGLPLGRAAWGGEYRVLPASLRWGSLLAVGILGLAGWMVLARAGLVVPGAGSRAVRIVIWILAGYFTLNFVMNLLSRSALERYIMTPVSGILVVCFILVARW